LVNGNAVRTPQVYGVAVRCHMVEFTKTQITLAGIILAVLTIAGGSTVYLEKTNDYANCQGQWNLGEDGMSTCSKTGVKQYCYDIENRGGGWNRCLIGKPVQVPVEQPKALEQPTQKECPVRVIAYTDNGKWICDDIGVNANCESIQDDILPGNVR
jgi:hypothetical protein